MPISSENFKFIQEFARESAAIVLEPGKEYLVESRLTPIAHQSGFDTLDDFLNQLRIDRRSVQFHEQVIDALTTNETSFFRDFHPFEALRQHVLPRLIEQRAGLKRLSIWSAASSTGQEPYSIAMLLREHFPQLAGWTISILATDLSPTVLAQARQGTYSQLEVNRGLPAAYLLKYFTKVENKWAIKDDIKKMVDFRQMNLFKPWPILPVFDVVLIRNVMIYFDVETKRSILKRIRQCLQPQGCLFLGTAETTMNLDPDWHPVTLGKATVYQIAPALAQAA
ncbi:MAG TPA: protein-glutamate O-methyltransferase CheR [Methylomirabilota bacterium]|nr:protein-glutamate O-methyltransferase CheR [Methylomirabilota bacterium]